MKTKINGIEVEGTPQEMKELLGKEQISTPTPTPTHIRKYTHTKMYKVKKRKYSKVKLNSHMPWTASKRKELVRRFEAGESVPSMAKDFNRTKAAIRTQYSLIKIRDIKLDNKEVTAPHGNRTWTGTEDYTLMKELRNGNTQKKIGKLLGRTHEAVKMRIKILRKKYNRTEQVNVGQDTSLPKKISYMG